MAWFAKMRNGIVAGAVALIATILAASAPAAPRDLDRTLNRATDKGLFRVEVASAVRPIPMNAIHRWTVRLTDASGRPVAGAAIAVDGGMPEHHHGLPTAPRAIPGSAPGNYVIQGMKFSMDGWWELKLDVRAAGRSDTVTFNIVL